MIKTGSGAQEAEGFSWFPSSYLVFVHCQGHERFAQNEPSILEDLEFIDFIKLMTFSLS